MPGIVASDESCYPSLKITASSLTWPREGREAIAQGVTGHVFVVVH